MLKWNDKLIEGIKNGDDNAMEQCYRMHSSSIYSAIFRICQNMETANDLLHDTFIDVFEHIESYRTEHSFIAWIKRIAFNNTFNYLNRSVNKIHCAFDEEKAESLLFLPEQALDNTNLLELLLIKVSEGERLILWLFIVEQYSHDEIALLVKQSPSYSKSIVSRVLKRIRLSEEVKAHAYN